MALNQPPITGDVVLDAWMLEVTRELNLFDRTTQGGTTTAISGGGSGDSSDVESWALRDFPDLSIPVLKIDDSIARDDEVAVSTVDDGVNEPADDDNPHGLQITADKELSFTPLITEVTTGAGLALIDGVLGFDAAIIERDISQASQSQNVIDGRLNYPFTMWNSTDPIPADGHLVYMSGMKLIEGPTRDYELIAPNIIQLTQAPDYVTDDMQPEIEVIVFDVDVNNEVDILNSVIQFDTDASADDIRGPHAFLGISLIPSANALFIGGMKMVQGIDYTVQNTSPNTVTLLRSDAELIHFRGLVMELSRIVLI